MERRHPIPMFGRYDLVFPSLLTWILLVWCLKRPSQSAIWSVGLGSPFVGAVWTLILKSGPAHEIQYRPGLGHLMGFGWRLDLGGGIRFHKCVRHFTRGRGDRFSDPRSLEDRQRVAVKRKRPRSRSWLKPALNSAPAGSHSVITELHWPKDGVTGFRPSLPAALSPVTSLQDRNPRLRCSATPNCEV
jgi:hypothetical protein